ncbi:MAG TPA: thioesterase family protein [Chitinophagaceae bacterium]|jgi:acyl-CoA thioesterase FadM|nr:thioesterase family protein [Chitinophagaceae bacterium]
MPRVSIELPASFTFSAKIPVRITDLNYGGHVGNDKVLALIHEARLQFLAYHGCTELDFGGTGMIMSDVAISFKQEIFYGDTVIASVALTEIAKTSFALYYKLEKETGDKTVLLATARTSMVCFDYAAKKMVTFPEALKERFTL